MAESDWLIVGLLIGIPVGVCLGWLIAQILKPAPAPASVIFDRDEEKGYIVGIHYVPLKGAEFNE